MRALTESGTGIDRTPASNPAALDRNFARLTQVNDSALIPGNNVNIPGGRPLGEIFERRWTGVPSRRHQARAVLDVGEQERPDAG
jgi:hypothetical protein